MQDEEFIQSFIEESRVHIETLETELLNMDLSNVDSESINNIFRAVHSIKGTSGFFDFKKIVELSHALENLFGEIREGNLDITYEMVDVLLAANDCLKSMIEDVMNSENVDISEHVIGVMRFLSGEAEEESGDVSDDSELDYGTDDISPGTAFFDMGNFRSSEEKKKKLRSEIDRGCRLFTLKRKIYKDLISNNINLTDFIREIGSYGSVIDCSLDGESLLMTDVDEASDIELNVLFTTVLEKDFLPDSISLPSENFTELEVKENLAVSEAVDKVTTTKTIIKTHEKTVSKEKLEEKLIGVPNIIQTDEIEKEKQKSPALNAEDSVRVSVNLLNSLLNLSSEMVLARNQLLRKMEKYRKGIPGIDGIFQNINHITTNLQETVMQTRMQPVSNVFSKFPRIVRELSKKLNKDIALELEGVDVELDKSIIEALGDPLTHLVRNAIDHGMEQADERALTDKPRMGTIKLKAYHESGYVNIDVIDDGKGINTTIIRQKAFEKGFINKADIDILGEQESLQLLFKPGFSTASAVTDLSGRGVGMDVVKTNIEKLGGKIETFTNLGSGTTFRLLLPLTLAIIPSLIVETEKHKFALPQINVQEIVRIKANDPGRKIEYINDSEVLRLRGRLLPIVQLADVLGLERTYIDPETGLRIPDKRKRLFDGRRATEIVPEELLSSEKIEDKRSYKLTNIVRVLVIKIGARRLGLSVDTIHGSEEILVKTLPIHVKECKNYSGVTILGDGKAAMILDPSGIIENSNLRYLDGQYEMNAKQAISEAEKMRENQNLLLFKCFGPETLALDMAMVSRVEEIMADEIERIGDKEYIRFRGESLRVVRPQDYIPISKQQDTELEGKHYVIIPKLVKHPMGILIEKMNDTVQTSIKMNREGSINSKGLIGSTIINDKIVLLLNIYELFEMADPEQYKVDINVKNQVQMRVLLVEDTPFFQKLEKDYLQNAGYEVFVADNGKEALRILEDTKVDAIVSDINMPEMNGIELIKRIRSDSKLSSIPVIAVTSLTGEHQKKEGLAAGFDAYEFKLDRARLIDVLEEVMKTRRTN